jgi:NTE family protein
MFWNLFGKKKIGLVLGGGVARGLAHVGILKVIEKYRIPIDYIAATSSGAIIAAAYAAGLEVRLIEQIALRIKWGKILKITFFRPGFVSGEAVEEMVIKYIGDKDFSELKIPLSVVAADIKSGGAVVLNKGKVARAVAASMSIPGIFAPEEINHRFLVDGGLGDNLPVSTARKMGAGYVIAVDVVPSQPVMTLPKDPFQMYGRAFDILMHKTTLKQRREADILIEPHIDEDIWHTDLGKADRLIAAGEAAAKQALRRLRR